MRLEFQLFDAVIDKISGKLAAIVHISNATEKTHYLIEPDDNSFDLEWRTDDQLELYLTEETE